jgi:DNA invertase Pin-like site-specific DNA recombinase
MTSIRELGERGIVLRSLREGIDTSNATGRMVAGVLASVAELELELRRERRAAARKRGGHADSPSGGRRRLIEESRSGSADACRRGIGHHDRYNLRGQSSHVYRVLAEQAE